MLIRDLQSLSRFPRGLDRLATGFPARRLHALLRLPTGIFYAQGGPSRTGGKAQPRKLLLAKAFGVRGKPAAEKPWTEKLWIYDLRTNKHFTLKENPLKRADLDDFVACYNPKNRHERKESERFKVSPTKY